MILDYIKLSNNIFSLTPAYIPLRSHDPLARRVPPRPNKSHPYPKAAGMRPKDPQTEARQRTTGPRTFS